jgi:putative zinc finger/helix-turn-helix YgiT family protein
MKCPVCSGTVHKETRDHPYLESGLDNVVLKDIDVLVCSSCGETIVSIPAIDELHTLLGRRIVKKGTLLTSKEIKYLRKNMGISARKLSSVMGVDNATVSRWENDKQRINKPHDFLLRLIYCTMKGIPSKEVENLIQEDFPNIGEIYKDIPAHIIPQTDWSKEGGCSLSSER